MEQILLPTMEYIQSISHNLKEENDDILSIVAWVPKISISYPVFATIKSIG